MLTEDIFNINAAAPSLLLHLFCPSNDKHHVHLHVVHSYTKSKNIHLGSPLPRLVRDLGSQGCDFCILDFEGHPILGLSLPQINANFTNHLNTVAVLSSDEADFASVVLQL